MTSIALFKIKDFLNLKHGWCYGEGKLFTEKNANIAEQIITSLLSSGFDNLDAFPGLSGEIRVTAYFKTQYLEFTVENENSITFLHENNNEELEYQENINLTDCFRKIKELGKLCNSYVLSTHDISIKTSKDFKVLHSNLRQAEEFPYFVTSVQSKPVEKFVNTSKNTTPKLVERLLSFGCSTPAFCQ